MSSGIHYCTNSLPRHISTTCKHGIMKQLRGVMTEVTTSSVMMRHQFQEARMQLELKPPHLRKVKAEGLRHQLLVENLMEKMDTGTHSSISQLLMMNLLTIMPQ